MVRKKTLSILAVALVALVAAACGGGAEAPTIIPEPTTTMGVTTGAPTPTEQPAEVGPTPTATAFVVPIPASSNEVQVPTGGVLRRLWIDPPTLDPHLTTDTASAGIVVEIFSGLVALDTNLKIVPDIAERWDIEDGMVYTFYLRRDAKFHDGTPVTAQDFKWSFERAADPKTESPVADTYLGDIIGVKDKLEGKATEVRGVKVIDDYTLQIAIDAPKSYFLAKLTYPTAYVLDKENVEKGGRIWTDHPNGTGPFKLAEYLIGERLVLERNEYFYRGVANLDKIIMPLSGGQAMTMYENDEIDITGVGLFDLDRVQDPNEPLNKELVTAPPEFQISYIGFNVQEPPFDDVKFRQALTYAIDKELIADQVLSNLVVPAYGVLPPGFPAYNPDLQGLKFDLERAQQLLAESKYADPATRDDIRITVPGTGGTIGLDLEVIIELWEQLLGVQVEIRQVEWATFLQDLNRQNLQAFAGLGWQADYPDPQDFLEILFHSKSEINHGAYSNPEVDSLLDQAGIEQDIAKRIELYQMAEKIIVEEAGWIPLWYGGERHVLIKPYVKGYKLLPMIVPKLKDVYIERS